MTRSKGFKKGLAARIGFNDATVVFQHRADRLANVIVVVDDEDLGAIGNRRSFDRVSCERHVHCGRLSQPFLDRLRQLSQRDGFVQLNAVVKGDVTQGSVEMSPVRMMNGIGLPSSCRTF